MGNCISVGQPYERLDDSEEGYDVVHVIDDCQVPVRHIPIDPPFNLNGCKELSDVTFVVDKTEFPAHRRILSERSDYFSAMFSGSFIEVNSDIIVLKETNFKAFTHVLEYIYTNSTNFLNSGKIRIRDACEVYLCAQYYMIDPLVKQMFSFIKMRGKLCPRILLNTALAYSINELIPYATDLILTKSHPVDTRIFDVMSPHSVEHLLKLRLSAPESVIFDALVRWMRRNPEFSSTFPQLLKYVELHLLDNVQLGTLFKPILLVKRSFFKKLLWQQQKSTNTVHKFINQNVINNINEFRVVEGPKTRSNNKLLTLHPENYITIDLEKRFLLNCLKFKLVYSNSYTVSVSENMRDWLIIDHSKYDCFGQQVLYFEERVVRFIRIQCNNYYRCVIDANIEALYSTDSFEIDSDTSLLVPKDNLIPTTISNAVDGWVNGEIIDGHIIHGFDECIIYQFPQPYIIGSLKLQLNEKCSYSIKISTDKNTWERVFAEKNVSGWRIATFEKRPVMFINIKGVKKPFVDFKLSKLECPAN